MERFKRKRRVSQDPKNPDGIQKLLGIKRSGSLARNDCSDRCVD
jgi:hypothetical protein